MQSPLLALDILIGVRASQNYARNSRIPGVLLAFYLGILEFLTKNLEISAKFTDLKQIKGVKMSLYNRNMPQNNYEGTGSAFGGAFEQSAQREATSARATFVKQTYQLLAASLLAATAGAYIGTNSASLLSGGAYWIAVIAEFACLFGLMFARKNAKLALILLFAFTFISGLVLGPTLARYIGAGMGNVITQAFLMTTVAFGGLSVFAMNTKRDFSAMGKFLFIALIVLIVASLINIFVGSSMLSLAVSGAGALIFSAYILYDTQNIIRGAYDSPVLAAVSLYLDILNLFISLLHILGALNSNK